MHRTVHRRMGKEAEEPGLGADAASGKQGGQMPGKRAVFTAVQQSGVRQREGLGSPVMGKNVRALTAKGEGSRIDFERKRRQGRKGVPGAGYVKIFGRHGLARKVV